MRMSVAGPRCSTATREMLHCGFKPQDFYFLVKFQGITLGNVPNVTLVRGLFQSKNVAAELLIKPNFCPLITPNIFIHQEDGGIQEVNYFAQRNNAAYRISFNIPNARARTRTARTNGTQY